MSMLFDKYIVRKSRGQTDPDAQYFVLRIDTDPAARAALLVYADQIKDSDPEFAKELQAWVWGYIQNASNNGLQSDVCPACGGDGVWKGNSNLGSVRCALCQGTGIRR